MSEVDIYVVPPQKYPRSIARDISSTVSVHQIINFSGPGDPLLQGAIWVSFMANVDWYPIFRTEVDTDPSDIPDPDPSARDTDEHQCFRVPANFELQRKIDLRTNHFKVVSIDDGVLRWHVASYDNRAID
jgi:hypothetical protein